MGPVSCEDCGIQSYHSGNTTLNVAENKDWMCIKVLKTTQILLMGT